MAIYGNKTTMSGEVNPNNFATRPGVFPNTHPAPSHDYLFGSNMGLPELENNLSISKARIKSVLPYPLNFGDTYTVERIALFALLPPLAGFFAYDYAEKQGLGAFGSAVSAVTVMTLATASQAALPYLNQKLLNWSEGRK